MIPRRKHNSRRVLAAFLASILFLQQAGLVTLAEELREANAAAESVEQTDSSERAGGEAAEAADVEVSISNDEGTSDSDAPEKAESVVEIVDEADNAEDAGDSADASNDNEVSQDDKQEPAEAANPDNAPAADSGIENADSAAEGSGEAVSENAGAETGEKSGEEDADAETGNEQKTEESDTAEAADTGSEDEVSESGETGSVIEIADDGENDGNENGGQEPGEASNEESGETAVQGSDENKNDAEQGTPAADETVAVVEAGESAEAESSDPADNEQESVVVIVEDGENGESSAEGNKAEETLPAEAPAAEDNTETDTPAGEPENVEPAEEATSAAEENLPSEEVPSDNNEETAGGAGSTGGAGDTAVLPSDAVLETVPETTAAAAKIGDEIITITFKYDVMTDGEKNDEGGTVSRKTEKIKIRTEEAEADEDDAEDTGEEILGAVAEANEGYIFTGWTLKVVDEEPDENEEETITYELVSEEAELIPEVDMEETATYEYFANFEKHIPSALDLTETTDSGIKVTVKAEEGIYPEGTVINVSDAAKEDVLEEAQTAVASEDDKQNIIDVAVVNIAFEDEDGNAVEPLEEGSVKVELRSLKLKGAKNTFALTGTPDEGDLSVDPEAETGANTLAVEVPAGPQLKVGEVRSSEISVIFYEDEEGESELLTKVIAEPGDTIGSLPEAPFKEGCTFLRWVNKADRTQVITADTEVTESLEVVPVFSSIKIYDITATYFYVIDGQRVEFETETYEVEGKEITEDTPYVINVPKSTQVAEEYDPSKPTYFPTQSTVEITVEDLAAADAAGTNVIAKEVEYVEYTAVYDFVYLLKDLDGASYTEIGRETINGVLGSVVTPVIKDFDHAEYESTESATITQREGQELNVYYTRTEYTLSYDTMGGSYIAPVTVPYGTEVAVGGSEPTRTGYEFAGWYEDRECTTPAGTSYTIEGDTILFAKWTPKNVGYTIVYMKEHYDNETGTFSWVYDRSAAGSAQVGSVVVATDAPGLVNNINGYEKDNEKNAASQTIIKADGSSVLTVYYKLIRYTLEFTHRTNNNFNNASVTVNGTTYTNRKYTIDNVVLGQDINSLWPTEVNSGRSGYYFTGWTYTNEAGGTTNRVTKVFDLTWELVTKANTSHVAAFDANYEEYISEYRVEYWLQQPDGTYVKDESLSQVYYSDNNSRLEAKDVDGYTQHNGDASAPAGYDGSEQVVASVTEVPLLLAIFGQYVRDDNQSGGSGYTYYPFEGHLYREKQLFEMKTRYWLSFKFMYRFYYDRDQFRITYYDGGTKLKETDPIFFEADISGAQYNYTPAKPAGKEDHTWGGWQADPDLQTPYTFTTMPGSNLAVYAKWTAPQYTVTFDPQGGSGDFPDAEVEKGKTVGRPDTDPVKENYTFAGWYTAAEGGEAYDWNQPVTGSFTLYAHYKQKTLSYTVHYYEEGTTNKLLPDKIVKSPALKYGQTITEDANSIAGFQPDAAEKSLTLEFDDAANVMIFYYAQRPATTTYTVHYVLASDTDIKVHESKTVTVPGSQVDAIETAVSVDKAYMETQTSDEEILAKNYHPIENSITLILTSDPDQNVITFKYADYKSTRVTVNYLDMDGEAIPGSRPVSVNVREGGSYRFSARSFNGYQFKEFSDSREYTGTETSRLYNITDEEALTINVYYQKVATITANNKTKPYDGTELKSEGLEDAEVDGLLAGHALTSIEYEGSRTEVGTGRTTPKNAVISGVTNPDYYVINYVAGNLTVTGVDVVINVDPDRWADGPAYDGNPRTIGFRDVSTGVLFNSSVYEELYGESIRNMVKDISRTETDAGEYTIPAATIRAAITLPEDNNFTVTLNIRDGYLKIAPAELTVTTGSDTKTYDGDPLTKDEITVEGLVGEETVTAHATGVRVDVGESDNTYQLTWNGTAKKSNYVVKTEDLGILTVTPGSVKLTANSGDAPFTYNGSEYTVSGFTSSVAGLEFTGVSASGSGIDAGPYEVTFTGVVLNETTDTTGNYVVTEIEKGSFTILPAPVKLTANSGDGPITYDGSEHVVEGYTSSVKDLSFVDIYASGTGMDVGVYDVTFSDNLVVGTTMDSTGNYIVTEAVPGSFTIVPAEVKLTASSADAPITYDGDPHIVEGYTCSVEGLSFEGVSASGTGINAGDYDVTFTGVTVDETTDTTGNYVVAEIEEGSFTIVPAPVKLTANSSDEPFTYDGREHTVSGFTSSVEGLTFTGVSASGTGINAGPYEVTFTGVVLNETTDSTGNYVVANVEEGSFTIVPAGVTLIAASGDDLIIYDGQEHTVSGFTSSVDGLRFEGVIARGAGSQVGDYDVTFTGVTVNETTDTTGNYVVTAVEEGIFTIAPAPVTVTAKNSSKAFGTADPDFEAEEDGVLPNEDFKLVYEITRTGAGEPENEKVGTYFGALVPSGEEEQGNYIVYYVNGDFEITQADGLTVTAIGYEDTYDGKSHEAGAEANIAEGTVISYSINNGESWSDDIPSITDVGEIPFLVKAENDNYKTVTDDAVLKVNPKPVTVQVNNSTKTYGDPDPAFEATVRGLLGQDKVEYTINRKTGAEDAGTYKGELVAEGEELQGNYTVTYEPGDLIIGQAGTMTVAATPLETVYDGQDHVLPEAVASAADAVIEYAVADPDGEIPDEELEWSTDRPVETHVTDWTIKVRATHKNYETVATTTIFKITPRPVTVTAEDKKKAYGEADPDLTVTIEGQLPGDVIGYEIGRDPGENVGEYAITPEGEEIQRDGNYRVTFVAGKLEITPLEITVTAEPKTKVYGDADPELTAVVTGLPEMPAAEAEKPAAETADGNGDNTVAPADNNMGTNGNNDTNDTNGSNAVFEPEYTLRRAEGEDVGTYVITPAGEEYQGNYHINYVTDNLTITPAAATVTAEDKTKVYGDADPAFTAMVDGLKNGDAADVIKYEFTRAEGEDAGEYAITPAGEAAQGNYTVQYVPGKLTITPYEQAVVVVISGEKKTAVYNGGEQSVTGYKVDSISTELYKEADIAFTGKAEAAGTDVKTGEDRLYYMGLAADQFTNNNKNFNNVTFVVLDGSLEITPAPATVKANDATKVQGTADPDFTAEVTGLFGEDKLVYAMSREAGEAAGSYRITPEGDALQGNYTVNYLQGVLLITLKPTIIITSNDGSKIYDGEEVTAAELEALIRVAMPTGYSEADYEFSYTFAGGETVKDAGEYTIITGVVVRDAQGNVVGEYNAPSASDTRVAALRNVAGSFGSAVGLIPMAAYAEDLEGFDLIVTPGTYTIDPRTATVTADNAAKRIDQEDPAFSVTLDNVIAGEENLIRYTVARKGTADRIGTLAGEIVPSGDERQGNYIVKFVPGDLTISRSSGGGGNGDSGNDNRNDTNTNSGTYSGGELISNTPEAQPETGVLGAVRDAVSSFLGGEDQGVLGADRGVLGAARGVLGAARTGDESGLLAHMLLMMLSTAGMGGMALTRRRKKED